ncbi:hypothetical protein B0H67DRAFT_677627 [Lasiosphaeris hirsuta]|uniref:Uncharacterized protein n=1 Tax=Lasiosphaeris hirsuta TaxID=260670 RepID=A0AA40B8J1_9PEZI|nr:hypothetical protein B0H67DRAFT_677627 [Lasiosphaeris hirsuta]
MSVTYRPPSSNQVVIPPAANSNYHHDGQHKSVVSPAVLHAPPSISNKKKEKTKNSRDWPSEPQTLGRDWGLLALSAAGDMFLLSTWLALAVFAVAILVSNGVAKADLGLVGEILFQTSSIAPTLFPILFTATVGRCVRLISIYRVEKGERLGYLDQFLRSTSFGGTLTTVVTMGYLLRDFRLRYGHVAAAGDGVGHLAVGVK